MAMTEAAFDLLFDLLRQVRDDEVEAALEIIRRDGANVSTSAYPPRLVDIVCQVPLEARGWLGKVLCVRAQQVGHKGAARPIAEFSSWTFD